jgi:hypothetical protein
MKEKSLFVLGILVILLCMLVVPASSYWNITVVDGIHGLKGNTIFPASQRSIVAEDNGQLAAVYQVSDGSVNTVYFAELNKNGNWDVEKLVDGSYPSIAIGSDGTLHVAYIDSTAKFLYYVKRPKDSEWSAPEIIWHVANDQSGHYLEYSSIVIDPLTNQPRICVNERRKPEYDIYSNLIYSERTSSGLWLGDSINGNTVNPPAIAIDSHGRPYIVFERRLLDDSSWPLNNMFYNAIFLKIRKSSGWSTVKLEGASSAEECIEGFFYKSIAINPVTDFFSYCYSDDNYQSDESDLVYGWERSGNSWSTKNIIGWGHVSGLGSSLAFNGNGVPAISYYYANNVNSEYQLQYIQGPRNIWQTPQTIDSNIGLNPGMMKNIYTSLAFDQFNRPCIVYLSGSTLSVARQIDALKVKRIDPNSGIAGTTVNPLHIYGSGFELGAKVILAPNSANPVEVSYPQVIVVSPTELTVSLDIPASMAPSSTQPGLPSLIRVRNPDGQYADIPFSIVAKPTISLAVPNGGENWISGSTQKIIWSYTGDPGSKVSIVLFRGNERVGLIASNVPISKLGLPRTGTGSYSWEIPKNQDTGSNYKIAIVSTSQPTIKDLSDNYFSITSPALPSITVTSPNGGESWSRGTPHDITWSYTGDPGSKVKIMLVKYSIRGGIPVPQTTTIADNIPTYGGSYPWTILSNQALGTTYKIVVQSMTQPKVIDGSDRYFIITAGNPVT